MKQFDLVNLKNNKPYIKYNLQKDYKGIIVDKSNNQLNILFFNPKNLGQYIIINVNEQDVEPNNEQLPQNLTTELLNNLTKIKNNAKINFESINIKQYATVELLVEDKKYSKFGIHKGAIGCVMDNNAVQDYIEVDFSGINNNGEYYGDCISVKINDLKVLD